LQEQVQRAILVLQPVQLCRKADLAGLRLGAVVLPIVQSRLFPDR
jgi:hypothetical protein